MNSNVKYDNWHLIMRVSENALPNFERALDGDDVALLAMEEKEGSGIWKFEAIYQSRPDISEIDTKLELAAAAAGIEMPVYQIGPMPNRNWLKESITSFPPHIVDSYYIYGSHIKDEPPTDKIPLLIDAATAFGSGEHPTTSGCLKAMAWLAAGRYKQLKRVRKVLDMGCGSGILGIAAAKTFGGKVFAVDIDKEAVRVTKDGAKKNGVLKQIKAKAGDGYKTDIVLDNGPFDLIFSNILARPLIGMAAAARRELRPNGIIVLSGLLITQEDWVKSAYIKQGLVLIKKYHIGEWSTLILHG